MAAEVRYLRPADTNTCLILPALTTRAAKVRMQASCTTRTPTWYKARVKSPHVGSDVFIIKQQQRITPVVPSPRYD